ncbi:Type I restriction-modification system, specificity subunit S [Streptococcus oralis]|uniref:Type I restriction-modification system, specificity subunit S n=1 Tax=Streptococcus oralis TaxID=1303 RepID=A0A139PJ57_STROR|nr:Type I restriction-modification system, specificity subunit S [Streptococcus oralis]
MNILEEIQNCPVEWKELGEVCEIVRGVRITKKELIEKGFPVVSGGTSFMGYTNKYNREANTITIAQYGTAGYVDWQSEKFWANDVCFSVYPLKSILNRFLYYFLKNKQNYLYEISNRTAVPYSISKEKILRIKIPILPLEIQEKIVQILDKMTEYVTELTSRKKQYSFYRDKLLSFEDEVYQVEWKTLGELFVFKNGLNKGKEFFGSGTPIVNYTDVYRNNKISANVLRGKVRVSPEEKERYGVQIGDVFFTRTSETQEEIGKTSVLLDEVKDGVFSGFVLRARPITKLLLPEYCAYCFESTTFRRDIVRYSTYTTRALTNGSALSKLKIPVPSLEIQSRIVEVLDNFDKVCNDLNIGLPKEIELRQKQYEYFREKLLTFVAEGEYTESRVE